MATSIIETKPSKTALSVTFLRAMTTWETNAKLRGVDPMAIHFLPAVLQHFLRIMPFWVTKKIVNRQSPGGYEFIVSRAVYFDQVFKEALIDGCEQIVFLGAGYDTKAYRYKNLIKNTKIIELDSPHTQSRKINTLKKIQQKLSDHVCYVSIDFNSQSLDDALQKAGYQEDKKTLFIWEGVTLYLAPEAVDSTLAFIHDHSGKGSSVIFDYLYTSVLNGECDYYGAKASYHGTWQKGERWVYGIEEGQIEAFLQERDFRILSHSSPSDLEKCYLDTSTNAGEKMLGCISIVHACVRS